MGRCEIIFRGHVQGVGFRCTARGFAEELGIVGWVRNLPDGAVQMVAEGEEALLEEFVRKLEAYFSVRDKTVVRGQAHGDMMTFDIVY